MDHGDGRLRAWVHGSVAVLTGAVLVLAAATGAATLQGARPTGAGHGAAAGVPATVAAGGGGERTAQADEGIEEAVAGGGRFAGLTARSAAGPSSLDAARSAVDRLLERRAAAVLRRDRRAWLATVDPRSPSFRRAQDQLFERLLVLRPHVWRYQVGDGAVPLPSRRRAVLGDDARVVQVHLAYRLGSDTRDVRREQHLTVVQRRGQWFVAGDADGRAERDLWDLGRVRVVRGQRVLVVGAASRAAALPRIAADADRAAAVVDRVWGKRWPRTVVLIVPASVRQLATLLGRRDVAGLDQVAAITSGQLQRDGSTSPGVADRVFVNPSAFADFSALGRRVVLTHELTHIATRASAVISPPLWVEEGFADYVGYLGSGLPRTVVAADLVEQVRAGSPPRHLPKEEAFDPKAGRIAPAYGGAWLAMELVASRGGTAAVTRFYRTAAGLDGSGRAPVSPAGTAASGEVATDAAMARAFAALGDTPQGFERRWRRYLETVAGSR